MVEAGRIVDTRSLPEEWRMLLGGRTGNVSMRTRAAGGAVPDTRARFARPRWVDS